MTISTTLTPGAAQELCAGAHRASTTLAGDRAGAAEARRSCCWRSCWPPAAAAGERAATPRRRPAAVVSPPRPRPDAAQARQLGGPLIVKPHDRRAADRAARPERQALQALVAARQGRLPDVRLLPLPRRLPADAAGAGCRQEHAHAIPSKHADRRRLRRSEGRHAEGRQAASSRARLLTGKVTWLLGTRAQLSPVWVQVQHPRQVGARRRLRSSSTSR